MESDGSHVFPSVLDFNMLSTYGDAESAVKQVRLCRSIRLALESKSKMTLEQTDPVLQWMRRFAGQLLTFV